MDKFGIFNLISSLIAKNSSSSTPSSTDENANTSPLNTLLNSIIQANSSGQIVNDASRENAPQKPAYTTPPLHSAMLSTMTAHDSFVERVKKQNQKV